MENTEKSGTKGERKDAVRIVPGSEQPSQDVVIELTVKRKKNKR